MTVLVKCPIKGCNYLFQKGILGWHRHIESPESHPYWHENVTSFEERKTLFQVEFPEFFEQAIGFRPPSSAPPAAWALTSTPPPASAVPIAPIMPSVPDFRRLIDQMIDLLVALERGLRERDSQPEPSTKVLHKLKEANHIFHGR